MSNNGYDPEELLSIRDLARILKRTPETIRAYTQKYNIPHVRHKEGYKGHEKIYLTRRTLQWFIYGPFNNGS